VWAASHFPEVNDVTDQIDNVGFVVPEEIEQPVGLSGAGTQVHVGDEDRAHAGVKAGFCLPVFPSGGHAHALNTIRNAGV